MSEAVDLTAALARFAALPRADQRAVLRLLARTERDALKALLNGRKRLALPAPRPASPAYSPWLAARLRELDKSDAILTDLTRRTLSAALGARGAP